MRTEARECFSDFVLALRFFMIDFIFHFGISGEMLDRNSESNFSISVNLS